MTRPNHFILLFIAVVVLGGGAYFSQRWFAEEFIFVQEAPGTVEEADIFASEEAIEASEGKQLQMQTADSATTVAVFPSAHTEDASTTPSNSSIYGTIHYVIPVLTEGAALDAMHAFADASNFSFSGRNFPGLGFFIEEIGGHKNADGNYWFLYINDESSQKGASQTKVSPGDIVEWRYKEGY